MHLGECVWEKSKKSFKERLLNGRKRRTYLRKSSLILFVPSIMYGNGSIIFDKAYIFIAKEAYFPLDKLLPSLTSFHRVKGCYAIRDDLLFNLAIKLSSISQEEMLAFHSYVRKHPKIHRTQAYVCLNNI